MFFLHASHVMVKEHWHVNLKLKKLYLTISKIKIVKGVRQKDVTKNHNISIFISFIKGNRSVCPYLDNSQHINEIRTIQSASPKGF